MGLRDKIPGLGKKNKEPEEEDISGKETLLAQDGHVSPEMCESELDGTWDDRKKQCIVQKEDMPDGTKRLSKANVKIVGNKRRGREPKAESSKDAAHLLRDLPRK